MGKPNFYFSFRDFIVVLVVVLALGVTHMVGLRP